MTSPKRDAPNHAESRKDTQRPLPPSIEKSGNLTEGNAGVAPGRPTEDDLTKKKVDQSDGWNSNT